MDDVVGGYSNGLATIRSARATDIPRQLAGLAAAVAEADLPTIVACATLIAPRLSPGDYIGATEMLCHLEEYGPAEQVIRAALELFPKDLGLAVQQARIAQKAGDLSRALSLFQAIRSLAPYSPNSYYGEAECLRDLGRLAEAAPVIDAAVQRFPRDLPIATTKAELAERSGLLDEAVASWAQIRERFPDFSGGYLRGAKVLRDLRRFDEADALLQAAIALFPAETSMRTEYAWLAEIRGNWAEARARWQTVRTLYPNEPSGYVNGARVEYQEGHPDVAAQYLRDALARFPANLDVAAEWALIAVHGRQWETAARRWQELRERFPDQPRFYAEGVRMLLELNDFAAARQLCAEAAARFPQDVAVQDAARLLARRSLEPLHATLAARLAASDDTPEHHATLLQALLDAEAFYDIPAIAALAQARFPDQLDLYLPEAEAAERAGDPAAAEAVWARIQASFPDYQPAYRRHSALLAAAGDLVAAEALLEAACARFPEEAWPFREHAALAETRQDWSAAVRRWSLVEARFGENEGERLHVLRVRMLDREIELAQQAGGDLSALLDARLQETAESGDRNDSRTVMLAFESLGGITTGCEFGAVQRAFGAEPLGLLRWSGMALGTLIDLLERRFIDIGEPATTEVGTFDHGTRNEYSIRDKTFGFHLHSHVFDDEMDEPTFFAQVTKRMKFLARKMLDDLAAGEKLLLFKHSIREPSEDEVDRLAAALAGYGRNICLIVTAADADHPGGTVRELRDSIWLGYLDFSGEYDEERARKWLHLCRVAYEKYRPI